MNQIRAIKKLGEIDIRNAMSGNSSWHSQYRHSAYVYIGGLNKEMNEGDIVTVFSQYGEIVDCLLKRDKETGESMGYCFLTYEDQRSTDLAVDNFNGIELCGRQIRVDHCEFKVPTEYLKPRKRDKAEGDSSEDEVKLYQPSGPDGKGWGEFRQLNENDLKLLEETPVPPQPVPQESQYVDEDILWDKALKESLGTNFPESDEIKKLKEQLQVLQEKINLKKQKKK